MISVNTMGGTGIKDNLTLIRRTKLTHADMDVPPERIAAHELAHVVLPSIDEAQADRQAFAWMAERHDGGRKCGIGVHRHHAR